MTCPVCHKDTRVVRTMKLDNPLKVIRSRVCEFCGYYFSTQESLDAASGSTNDPTPDKAPYRPRS